MTNKKRISVIEMLIFCGVFLAPFNSLTLNVAYITISDIFFILLFPVLFGQLSLNSGRLISDSSSRLKLIQLCWFFGMIFLSIGYLLSNLFNNTTSFMDTITTLAQYSFVFVYLPIVFLFIDKNNYYKLLKIYIFGVVAVILLGFFIESFSSPLYTTLINRGIFIGRNRFGSFLGSNGLTKTIAMCIPLVFFLLNKNNLKNNELILIIISFLVAILKASSIGGTVACIIAFVLSYSQLKYSKSKRNLTIFSLIIVIIFLYLVYIGSINIELFTERVLNGLFLGDLEEAGSFNLKVNLMSDAINTIVNNPIIGIGIGGFTKLNKFNQSVHNSYLLIWGEGGIFAFLGLLIIVLSSVIFVLKKMNKANTGAVFILIFLAIFSFNLLTGTHLYQRFRIIPFILSLYSLTVPERYFGSLK